MAPIEDHYRTLGVHRHAEQAVIEAAYRALVRRYHPDVNAGAASAEERLKQINNAYAVLSDPAERRAYNLDWDARNAAPRAKSDTKSKERSRQSQPPPPQPPPPPPTPTPPPPSQSAPPRPIERKQRPWYVKVIGFGLLILLVRGAFTSGSQPATNVRPAVARATTTSTPRVATKVPTQENERLIPLPTFPTQTTVQPRWGFSDNFDQNLSAYEKTTDLILSHIESNALRKQRSDIDH